MEVDNRSGRLYDGKRRKGVRGRGTRGGREGSEVGIRGDQRKKGSKGLMEESKGKERKLTRERRKVHSKEQRK